MLTKPNRLFSILSAAIAVAAASSASAFDAMNRATVVRDRANPGPHASGGGNKHSRFTGIAAARRAARKRRNVLRNRRAHR